ncbi:MAG: hypothetical protein GTN84_14540 [Hydrogenophaga sp.]|uniref:hypothetical protein n=1 Tax=Hydrogenophaga sp. TaxID=1904254 RepID=UPI0016AC04C9|nr:hypothetical protein [Hydrogenophaga sp.]NIM42387.1 hypothetical protein [Hydrogenophaga sp.]NIN27542.1 hypothetical protein [Hydrogenophaga sp.]NIN32361.1 hypothetical protein [Hydrogenophaga sp.]NIN56595.1 hypothetical protein [Hydrogenophaga sp.]NIO52958.1 hypothetical protein [Hydrogenophaga sp.]
MDLSIATPSVPLDAVFMRTRRCNEEISLHRLHGDGDIATVLSLREEIDLSVHAAAGARFQELEKKRDACGIVVAFDLMDQRIGTIRIVPLGYGLTLTEEFLPQLPSDDFSLTCGAWEVGRLVMAPQYRTDVDALRHCLQKALLHAFADAHVETLWATCTRALSRLYRRFGFATLAQDLPLPGTNKVYSLIRGTADDVDRALKRCS